VTEYGGQKGLLTEEEIVALAKKITIRWFEELWYD
jgi:hypothetical protein